MQTVAPLTKRSTFRKCTKRQVCLNAVAIKDSSGQEVAARIRRAVSLGAAYAPCRARVPKRKPDKA